MQEKVIFLLTTLLLPLGIYMKCISGKPGATQMLDKFSVASFWLFSIVGVRYVEDIINLSLQGQKISVCIFRGTKEY